MELSLYMLRAVQVTPNGEQLQIIAGHLEQVCCSGTFELAQALCNTTKILRLSA